MSEEEKSDQEQQQSDQDSEPKKPVEPNEPEFDLRNYVKDKPIYRPGDSKENKKSSDT